MTVTEYIEDAVAELIMAAEDMYRLCHEICLFHCNRSQPGEEYKCSLCPVRKYKRKDVN